MRTRSKQKTERLSLAVTPQLRAVIFAEAERWQEAVSSIVRTMLRAQLATMAQPTVNASAR